MPDHEGANVALFIDWDNLAISTAADHGGALPDLRRILGVAQSHGTVLVARAYAEWGVTSDRLTVYRAGIEPVYAPTFRFEADIPGQPSRGKSLADPCLVADCVDTLHLHPQIDTFVIVSGDKDLIPIVRLAQLRGKRVVVVGPDLVAAVLREMADEYVSYRSLVAGVVGDARSATIRAEAAELGRRRRRRRGRGGAGEPGGMAVSPEEPLALEETIQPAPVEPPARRERRERRPFVDRAGVFRPRADEPEAEAPSPAPPAAEVPSPAPPPRVEREASPPPRPAPAPARAPAPPRAPPPTAAPPPADVEAAAPAEGDQGELFETVTQILRERTNAGRPRLRATNLKDYLIARIPGFNERRYGFGQFRELLAAAQRAGVVQIQDEGQVQWISVPEGGAAAPAPSAAPAAIPAAAAAPATAAASTPAPEPAPAAPEPRPSAAGSTSIDPADAVAALVEVRQRAPFLTQGVVNSTLSAVAAERGAGDAAEEEARRTFDHLVSIGALRVDREPQEVELNGARHRIRLCHLADEHELVQRAQSAQRQAAPAEVAQAAGTPAAGAEEASAEPEAEATEKPAGRGRRSRRGGRGGGGAAAAAAEGGAETEAGAGGGGASAERATAAGSGETGIPGDVIEALVEAVRESIPPDRDTAGAAGVKSRLTRALGTFDEGALGFSKFKDFLLAAQKSGRIRVESAGAATRVGLAQG